MWRYVLKAQLGRTSLLGLVGLFRVRSRGFSVGLGQFSGGTTTHHTAVHCLRWAIHLSMYASGIPISARLLEVVLFSDRSAISAAVKPSGYFCSNILTAWWFDLCIAFLNLFLQGFPKGKLPLHLMTAAMFF